MDESIRTCPRCRKDPVGKFNNGKIRPVCIKCSFQERKEKKTQMERDRRRRIGLKNKTGQKCKICEEPFIPKTPTQVYCTEICKEKHKIMKLTEKWRDKEPMAPRKKKIKP